MKKQLSPGATGWIAAISVVAVADFIDERTMSEAFKLASRHPVGGPVIFASWAYLTAHLFGVIPEDFDVLHLLWKKVKK